MADYDTKIIPILDDIIEDQATVNGIAQETDAVAPDEAAIQAENNLDLFGDEPEQLIDDKNDPEVGAIVGIDDYQYDDSRAVDFAATEFTALHSEISDEAQINTDNSGNDAALDLDTEVENIESALIDDQITAEEDSTDFTANDYPNTERIFDQTPAVETQNLDALPLEALVDDIVKQLIPDLEQQLRYLVQQALEDRLSDTVLAQLGIKDKQS